MSSTGIDVAARWFAGKSRTVAAVVPRGGAAGLGLLEVRYDDGGRERYLDIPDRFAWAPLLERLAGGSAAGEGGRLELRPGPALASLRTAGLDGERVPATDQSNTLVALGERMLVKAYRRLEPGPHPEVELLTALAGSGAPVPAFAGSLHWVPEDGLSEPETAIAVLQALVPGAEDGWDPPIERAAAALRTDAPYATDEWAAAGRAAAGLHTALADAFGLTPATRADLARWQADAEAALAEAAAHDAELAGAAPRIRERLAAFGSIEPPPITRIHGDLHVGQLLRRSQRAPIKGSDPLMWGDSDLPLVIDFEGDPTRPLADRLAPDTPLRDLAGLLRCADHIGSAGSRRAGDADPAAWIAAVSDAALEAYAAAAPVPVDRALLAALELAKECSEFVYAQRVAPEWLYAPRRGMRRLLEA
jgi:predicted trehalose synthase